MIRHNIKQKKSQKAQLRSVSKDGTCKEESLSWHMRFKNDKLLKLFELNTNL